MNVKYFLIVFFTILGLQTGVYAQEDDELFTIYLVRHSEKIKSPKAPNNPPLSKCGKQRAKSLHTFFENVPLDAIYTSDYIRTKSTAEPTATSKKITPELYNPRKLDDVAKLLLERKEDVLVVGHSNTTGVLAGLLIDEEITAFHESIYNRIYQVVVYKNTKRLHILQSEFVCKK